VRRRELLDADWRRLLEFSGEPYRPRRWTHAFSPRFASVVLIRTAQRLDARGFRALARGVALVNFVVFGIEVPSRLDIGPGLVIPHTQGTIIGAGHIGKNVTIFQQVTIGARLAEFRFDYAARPHVGDGVVVGAGAKVLGPIRLEENAVVGANAVVLKDVPRGCLAVGVPARIVERTDTTADGAV
jgi:serine O-acetyltransferase